MYPVMISVEHMVPGLTFRIFYPLQVSSRLVELETTLDAGIRHRNKALTSISFHVVKWMKMVWSSCFVSFLFE